MPSVHASLQAKDGLVNKVKFVGSIPNVIRTNQIVGLLIHYYPYSSETLPIYSGTSPRCLSWLTRLLVFVKGWGLEHNTKAVVQQKHGPLFSHPVFK